MFGFRLSLICLRQKDTSGYGFHSQADAGSPLRAEAHIWQVLVYEGS